MAVLGGESEIECGGEGAETDAAAEAELRAEGEGVGAVVSGDVFEGGGEVGGGDEAGFPTAKRGGGGGGGEAGGFALVGRIRGAADVVDPGGGGFGAEGQRVGGGVQRGGEAAERADEQDEQSGEERHAGAPIGADDG